MRIEIGRLNPDHDVQLEVQAAAATVAFPLNVTLTNLAPRCLYVGKYLSAAGSELATAAHTFASRDELVRWVSDVQQIADMSNYVAAVVLEWATEPPPPATPVGGKTKPAADAATTAAG